MKRGSFHKTFLAALAVSAGTLIWQQGAHADDQSASGSQPAVYQVTAGQSNYAVPIYTPAAAIVAQPQAEEAAYREGPEVAAATAPKPAIADYQYSVGNGRVVLIVPQ